MYPGPSSAVDWDSVEDVPLFFSSFLQVLSESTITKRAGGTSKSSDLPGKDMKLNLFLKLF
jgi:hypothetical protein